MFLFWIIVGVALGYFFKPQIDKGVRKAIKHIKDNRDGGSSNTGSGTY